MYFSFTESLGKPTFSTKDLHFIIFKAQSKIKGVTGNFFPLGVSSPYPRRYKNLPPKPRKLKFIREPMASENFSALRQKRSCALVPLGDQETPPGTPILGSPRGVGHMRSGGGHPQETADDSPRSTEPEHLATILDTGRRPSTPTHGRDFIAPEMM